jgi:sortase (surface protein transpeptidase)
MTRSDPTKLTIRSIGVNAPFTPLSMDATGVLQPPPETNDNLAGWYKDGPTPGELGNAIVAGHVDTKTGPAVFFLLAYLRKGDPVVINRADGTVATFKVDYVQTFSKGAFPDQQVYGNTPDAELRIITCGGTYDHKKKDYESNVVVFAHLASAT